MMPSYIELMQGSERERQEAKTAAKMDALYAEALRLAHHYRRMWREEKLENTGNYRPRVGEEDPLAVPGEDD